MRGHDVKLLPKLKLELLRFLVDGSMALKDTKEYRDFAALRAKMETEKAMLSEHNEKRCEELERAAEERKVRNEKKREEKKVKQRKDEISRQKVKHVISLPSVHPCKLAHIYNLMLNDKPRQSLQRLCNVCSCSIGGYSDRQGILACDACNWDICTECHRVETMSPAERRKHDARKAREEAERNRVIALRMKRHEEECRRREEKLRRREEAIRAAYEPSQFKKSIREPSKAARDRKSARGYIVWKSLGYPPDGFHSYAGPPKKDFDSSWSSLKDANLRARFLFFIDNAWGIGPHEFGSDAQMKEKNGMERLEYIAGDSEEWTVGVVSADSFALMDNVEQSDDDEMRSEDDGCAVFW